MDKAFFAQTEAAVMQVLKDVRPELMAAYGTIDYVTKTDKTVVTHLDKSIELSLREVLLRLDPGIGLLGEEHGQEGSAKTYWLIDPIDGTEHFIRGMPGCKNLICLMDKGRPVWTLMYMFSKDELWLARAGEGATMNGQKVEMRWRPVDRCWLEMTVDLFDPENVQKLLNLRKHIAGFSIRMGVDNIAAGRIDGLLNLKAGGGPWDYWPRYLLFTETGGKMANLGKDGYDFNDKNFLVAHARNFEQLMKLVTD